MRSGLRQPRGFRNVGDPPASLSCGLAVARTKTLCIGMNGGTLEKTYTGHVFGAFEKANNVKVVVVPGTPSDILAKAQANNDNPQMHVMFPDDGIMYRATRIRNGPGRVQNSKARWYSSRCPH